jgi:hypothetical protein
VVVEGGSRDGEFDLCVGVYGRRWGNQISGAKRGANRESARSMMANQCASDSRRVKRYRNDRLKERL